MDLVRSLQHSRRKQQGAGGAAAGMDGRQVREKKTPKLDRRNAVKNIEYEIGGGNSVDSVGWGGGDGGGFRTRSLDISPSSPSTLPPTPVYFASQTSFRIGGEVEGEFDSLCRSLGLSGPEDFAITPADWAAASMDRSTADHVVDDFTKEVEGRLRPSAEESLPDRRDEDRQDALRGRFNRSVRVSDDVRHKLGSESRFLQYNVSSAAAGGGGGIKGARPSMLVPPPSMSLPSHDQTSSTWDLFNALAPADGANGIVANGRGIESSDSEEEEPQDVNAADDQSGNSDQEDEKEVRLVVIPADRTGSCSSSNSMDDDSPSAIVEGMYTISPYGKLKRNMVYWEKGRRLGSGSFGTVYEAISDNGFFFAIKEVSLLDQGAEAQQCISQLEQEIALLSQFEHENIVQYYGTDKAESNLYIFLELITQGSLVTVYQNYKLGDLQVSAYTRQILNGLKYLHERNVVHRDIKCANILVDAHGLVKLADFGLAKQTSKINELKSCKGSVYWMAPEVVRPKGSYGAPADIWSLGCTVLEMLTRQVPYPNQEWTHVLFHVGRGGQPKIPENLSRDARDFIQQCIQKNPEDRPTAAELLEHPFVTRSLRNSSGSDSSSHGRSRHSLPPLTPSSVR
ncbi:unnamed protein product [Spirodela intermedia]|uniref:mitogen-activated protein kinase kinase kinase n=2 Tax=Spirodela intermedia TaxID=51605 RepID=A0A7I8KV82_SPIIN|nr:unnamed protein product [Spirodela intermedia]CAA6664316.1 unnamed protein product [Spirodela intermedia]CAA7400884.1 unnamed protein product [Spirodela intermedia]